MENEMIYYLWAVLLIFASAVAWASQLFALPGNWIIAAMAALFAFLVPADETRGIGWATVIVIVALAGVGELIEFLAGAAGAAKHGASRRSMVLAILGTMVGSLAGAFVGVPIPILGPLVGAVGGGALGAFLGAYAGETWKGRGPEESLTVGKAALVGRLLGALGKLLVGAVIFVVVVNALF